MRITDSVGPYEVVRALGSGGFGKTWEGRHRLLGERACLKLCHDKVPEELVLNEARVLWNLYHPSLPTLRDLLRDETSGRYVLAMRFVEGTVLTKERPLDLPTAIQVMGRMLRVLKFIHRRGIVHGDIKPANIILEPGRHNVVLVDLGTAIVKPTGTSKPVAYTPAFAAPETIRGAPPLPESDLYSLGLTMMHLLGGDIQDRELPKNAPPPLLELLVALTRKDFTKRPRWGRDDPIAQFQRIVDALAR